MIFYLTFETGQNKTENSCQLQGGQCRFVSSVHDKVLNQRLDDWSQLDRSSVHGRQQQRNGNNRAYNSRFLHDEGI